MPTACAARDYGRTSAALRRRRRMRERTGVEKVMGKMHFYVCERVKNRTNLHRPDGSRPSLWLGLSWPAAAWLLSGSRRQCDDTPPQHRQSTLLPSPSPPPAPCRRRCLRALCLIFLVVV